MDGFNSGNRSTQDPDEPIPFGEDIDEPIDLTEAAPAGAGVSHSPLDLGGATSDPPKVLPSRPVVKQSGEKIVSTDRITGIKTFFTKLHPGAMLFLDDQISAWLRDNPGIVIKRTDTTVGEIQAKKTEPNIIITVWY